MFIYNLVIFAYGFVIQIASIRQLKARQWIAGRKNWRHVLSQKLTADTQQKRIWVHCASYGEFEQGRPLIEAIKKKHPEYKIILSFFSPSGYEAFKDWKGADVICYLPLDTKKNAKDFIKIVNPQTVIFIKYEFWVNFLFQLKKQNIASYLVSATFKPHHPFFKWYGSFFRRSLTTFRNMFLQDENSAKLIESIGLKNYKVIGDTRFDRVLEIKQNFKEIEAIKNFKGNKKLIIAGSTWEKDVDLVLTAFKSLKESAPSLVLVPHDVSEKSIQETILQVQAANLSYSLFNEKIDNNAQVLIVNVMGLLSKIYFYADCSYIGGGFNGGIHNCLEASVYGKAISFYGKDYVKFNEAVDLMKLGAASLVNDANELKDRFEDYLSNEFKSEELAQKLDTYFVANSNVTDKILLAIDL